jgi:hypothetical protein
LVEYNTGHVQCRDTYTHATATPDPEAVADA